MYCDYANLQVSTTEPPEGYALLQSASSEHLERAPKGPASTEECEVLMMVGLPAAGKTTWAEKHCRQNPDKRYTVLGTNVILDKMKVRVGAIQDTCMLVGGKMKMVWTAFTMQTEHQESSPFLHVCVKRVVELALHPDRHPSYQHLLVD